MDLYAATIRVPSFTPAGRAALRAAGVSLFRIPTYDEAPTDVRVELLAASGASAEWAVARALGGAVAFVAGPWFIGGELWDDGPPENEEPVGGGLAESLRRAALDCAA